MADFFSPSGHESGRCQALTEIVFRWQSAKPNGLDVWRFDPAPRLQLIYNGGRNP